MYNHVRKKMKINMKIIVKVIIPNIPIRPKSFDFKFK